MKKINIKLYLFCFLFIYLPSVSVAQSDYATVQKFSTEFAEIEQRINNASSTEEMTLIREKIEQLKTDFSGHSALLNKALYPENFQSMIDKLNGSIALREDDFTAVEVLKVEVSDLNQKVDTLSTMNNELQASLKEIQLLFEKSNREMAKLNNIISDLKIALHKRDVLVMSMIDSLMPPVMRQKPLLSSEDKEQILSDVAKNNILVNVKTTIADNIKYLDLTSLQPQDLTEIQEQQLEFSDTWARIGPKLAEVYSDDNRQSSELLEIDSLFTLWTTAIEKEAWQSIQEEFAAKGLPINDFSNGEEFTKSINQYIDAEKNTIDDIPEKDAENAFIHFAENTWDDEIKPRWVSFLVENEMLNENNEKDIEENIEIWRSELYPSNWWIWLLLPGILLAGLALLLRILKKNSQLYDIVENERG